MTMRILLIGATGVVGQQVLQQALVDARISKVVALTRRPLSTQQTEKLESHVVDFSDLNPDAPWWQVDAVICALGTTMQAAGSRHAFAAVDRDMPVAVAKLAQAKGATRYALNSSLGASLDAGFYLRTKAETEAQIRALAFAQTIIVRPSLIDADRIESRPLESVARLFARIFRGLIPRRYRAVKPASIAHALLEGVLADNRGEHIIESESL